MVRAGSSTGNTIFPLEGRRRSVRREVYVMSYMCERPLKTLGVFKGREYIKITHEITERVPLERVGSSMSGSLLITTTQC